MPHIDTNARYNKPQIASLLGITQNEVESLWNKWGTPAKDRLQNATDSMGKMSYGSHLIDYCNRVGIAFTLPPPPPPPAGS